jgi:hypothetical protein
MAGFNPAIQLSRTNRFAKSWMGGSCSPTVIFSMQNKRRGSQKKAAGVPCERRSPMTASKKQPSEGAQGQAGIPDAIARAAAPDSSENKDPNGEYENPAPLENRARGPKPAHHDLQGQQGGQKGGSREPR